MIISNNAVAAVTAYNLDQANVSLRKSITRLSSGLRINSSVDDPGGLAVSLKLSAAIRRTDATSNNMGNALSFLQTQDGVLKTANDVLLRMSELAALASSSAIASNDRTLYNTEFSELDDQITNMLQEDFNGISLFATSPSAPLQLRTTISGVQTMGITQADLDSIVDSVTTLGIATVATATVASDVLETAIQNLAVLRATNGAEQSRVTFAQDILEVNRTNLEAAHSQIMDADIARESTNYARNSIIAEAGVAMLAQANTISERALKLLEFD